MELHQEIWGSVRQFLTLSAVPFLWWFITARKKESFFRWSGLYPFQRAHCSPGIFLFCAAGFICYCLITQFLIIPQVIGPNVILADDKFSGAGISGLVPALFYGFLRTGLTEELFFRGFLGKRFAAHLGFAKGNFLQGLLFGLLHGVLFFAMTSPLNTLAIITLTTLIGCLMGYADERGAGGSLLPSWLMHSFGNFVMAACKLFQIIS